MIRCPSCSNKLRSYCTKTKKGQKIRYYKCKICGQTFKTKLYQLEVEKIIKGD